MSESRVLNELFQHYREHRLAHAFLIETNNQEESYRNILKFFKMLNCPEEFNEECGKCNLCHLIDSANLPSLIKIEPDGNTIKKDQVMELKRIFKTKPVFSKYNMYVVLNSELMNDSSANTMLKFIEEPEEGIIGFFITSNKENMIDTIKSRCQIIQDFYQVDDIMAIPKVWKSIALNYVKEFELVLDEAMLYNKDVLLPLLHDRRELLFLFQSVFEIYDELYRCTLNDNSLSSELEDLFFIVKKGKIYISRRMKIVLDILDEINYNLNISLVLDKFVLEGSN